MTKQRVEWIDYAKGIGILLVVYAHLLSSGNHAGLEIPPRFFQLSDSFVYSFHMPLFFFLAGIFTESSYKRHGRRSFLLQKIRNIGYPYLLWSFIQASVELFFAGHSYRGGSLKQLLLIPVLPWAQFWFLYAILMMYLVFWLFKLLKNYNIQLMTLVAVFLFLRPIPSEYFGLAGFSTGLLFFVMGIWLQPHLSKLLGGQKSALYFLAFFSFFGASAYIVFSYCIAPTRLPGGEHPFYFILLAALGIIGSLLLSVYLAQRSWLPVLKVLGRCSLQIYLLHMLAGVAARIVLLKFFHLSNPVLHITIGVLVALAVPVFLSTFASRFHIPYIFAWSSRPSNTSDLI